jgi:uncharacterized protein (TIGR02466 family)
MFAKSTLLRFFPTFVWVFDLKPEDAKPLNAAIAQTVEAALPADHVLPRKQSLQSGTHLHELPEFKPLVERALAAGQQILKFLEHDPAPLVMTGCWANVSEPGAHHQEHSHPNNFLSGVYYVKAPEGGDTINFHDPRAQAHVIAPHVTTYSPKHASAVNVEVKSGRMVMFPAWLRHSVDPNRGRGQRMSIAFNLMLVEFTAQQSRARFKGHFLIKDGA